MSVELWTEGGRENIFYTSSISQEMFSMPLIQKHWNTETAKKKKNDRELNVSNVPLSFLLNKKNEVAGMIPDL